MRSPRIRRPARVEIAKYRALRGLPRDRRASSSRTRYLRNLDEFLATGRTPMPCHALRASCFIDPWGVVYPCITYSRPIGRLRETGMRLEPIWNAAETAQLQGEIWKGECPQCWTACEAYQSILGNALAVRRSRHAGRSPVRSSRPTSGARPMNVTCFADAVTRSRLDRADHASRGGRRVGGDRRQAGSAEHRRRHRSHPPLRERDRRRRRAIHRRHRRRLPSRAAPRMLADGGRGKGRGDPPRDSRTSGRR